MPAWSINNLIRTPLLLLGIGELLILFSSVYVGALYVYGGVEICEGVIGSLKPRAAVISIVILVSLIATGLYNFHQRIYFREVVVRLVIGFVLGLLVLVAVYSVMPKLAVSGTIGFVAILFALFSLLLLRYAFLRSVDGNKFRHRTLVFGAGERASAIADLRRKADRRGFRIVGSVPASGDRVEIDNNGVLIRNKALDILASELDADEIVIAMDDRRGNLPFQQLLNCKFRGIAVIDLLEFLERETGKIRVDLVNPGWLIFSPGFRSSGLRKLSKRVMDFIVSLVILLLSWPLMLLIAAAIKIEDGINAPVFYRQTRVGDHGKYFNVLKFRSMHENAEANGQAVWAEADDDRATRVGRVLRKYRLDELPQIVNVIVGQMSLVGPRPERPEFVKELSESIPYYSERHSVRPGITGWAQVRYAYGSSESDAIEKLQYDLYYVKNHNLMLDFMILLQTVEVILWGKGAR